MNLNKEKDLIELVQEDAQYFGILFDQYYSAIFNYTLKRTGDPELAKDITAETFFKALTNIHKFKWQGISISSWFYKIATNEIRMYFRKKKYAPQSLDLLFERGLEVADEHEFTQEIVAAQELVERHEEFLRAQALLANLPLKYQEVIALRFTEKKKLSEIAIIVGKKEGTVKSLLSRGLARLRRQMEQAQMQPSEQIGIVASEGRTILIKPLESYEE
jgi:RNA polymerase sigma-70 factor (ECF subfamily)